MLKSTGPILTRVYLYAIAYRICPGTFGDPVNPADKRTPTLAVLEPRKRHRARMNTRLNANETLYSCVVSGSSRRPGNSLVARSRTRCLLHSQHAQAQQFEIELKSVLISRQDALVESFERRQLDVTS